MGNLLYYAIVFLVVAVVAAALGFVESAGTAMEGARLLFWVALVLFVVSVVAAFRPTTMKGERLGAPRARAGFKLKRRSVMMNWDFVQGNWKQVSGKVKQQRGKLTDDDLAKIAGRARGTRRKVARALWYDQG